MQSSKLRFVSLFKVRTTGSDIRLRVNDVAEIGIISFDIQMQMVIGLVRC